MNQTNGFDFAFENSQHNRLTKREYFAAQALIGMATFHPSILEEYELDPSDISKLAVMLADALIEALNKEVKK